MKAKGKAQQHTPESLIGRGNGKPAVPKRLFTPTEAGVYLGFRSAWPVRTLQWNGELPFVRTGKKRIAFDVVDLDRFIESRKTVERSG